VTNEPEAVADSPRPLPDVRARFLLAAQAVVVALGELGRILTPTLVTHHPLMLLSLSAGDGTLALVASRLGAWEYYVTAEVRLLLIAPCAYIVGRYHLSAGLRRFERWRRLAEAPPPIFRGLAVLGVLCSVNSATCLWAGASRLSARMTLAAAISSVAARCWLIRLLAAQHQGTVRHVTRLLDYYQLPLTVLLVVCVLTTHVLRGRHRAAHIGKAP